MNIETFSSQTLADIKVQVESPEYETGNLHSILTEIKFSLQQLLEQKKSHTIDLRAMPWSPGEERKLEKYLGKGEVRTELDALGKSIFYETSYSGIWVVTHYSEDGVIIGKSIEVTYMPEMLFSQYEEVKDSLERIKEIERIEEIK